MSPDYLNTSWTDIPIQPPGAPPLAGLRLALTLVESELESLEDDWMDRADADCDDSGYRPDFAMRSASRIQRVREAIALVLSALPQESS